MSSPTVEGPPLVDDGANGEEKQIGTREVKEGYLIIINLN